MVHKLLEVRIDSKRRVALPSALLEAAGIQTSSALVAYTEAPGRFVIETPQAAVAAAAQRIWADLDSVDTEDDATADVRAMRNDDTRTADANAAKRSSGDALDSEDEAAGHALLTALGLRTA